MERRLADVRMAGNLKVYIGILGLAIILEVILSVHAKKLKYTGSHLKLGHAINISNGYDPLLYTVSTASSVASDWINNLTKTCLTSHPRCSTTQETENILPTRVVDVGVAGQASVRLVLPSVDNLQGRYTTLSYYWGGQSNWKLTGKTFSNFLSGIPMGLLPKTLRDAVYITRQLDIRYLWVDSMCILQDSAEDWKREASTMSRAYQNSFLTIAALKSESNDGGCFSLRNPLVHQPCWLFDEPDGTGIFALPGDSDLDRVCESFDYSPLCRRAWVLQERLLSPRIIYFGDSLIWECCESMISDVTYCRGETDFSERDFPAAYSTRDLQLLLYDIQNQTEGDKALEVLHRLEVAWSGIVDEYTSAGLTIKTDRPIAINGVVELIKKHTGFSNIAGLWEPFLMQQLLWECREQSPYDRRAPTWSWLAVDASISFIAPNPQYEKQIQWLSRILGVKIDRQTGSSDKEISLSGFVHIFGPLLRITKLRFDNNRQYPEDLAISEYPPIKDGYFDLDRVPDNPGPYFFLPIVKFECGFLSRRVKWGCYGLVIAPTGPASGAFERLGLLRTYILHGGDVDIPESDHRGTTLV